MNLFALKKSSWVTLIVVLVLLATALGFAMPIVVFAQAAPAPGAPAAQTISPGTTCDAWWKVIVNPICWGRGIAVYGSLLFIYLAGKILDIAGVLFNASIALTTIGFDSQIYNRVAPGIEAVWTAFRDIANIVIIGMFTFVALTMILGIEKFNARQTVAKVLVIAILINFSLLFTRIIISSSNFVATQFYKAVQFGVDPASTASALTSFGQYQTGVSSKFAQLLGVASFANTKEGLWKVAEGQDNGFLAAGMGMLTVMVMLAVALVFFYASFLLIARAILFIFLLITSSLAFAAHLIPGGGFGGYGWSSWWESLLKNAAFGPILLIMLWATMKLGEGIKGINSGGGSLGELFVDPAKGGGANALFSYLMILGMLYVSIKVASTFAGKIGGFNFAQTFTASPLALGARFAGFAGRNLIGRGAAKYGKSLDGRIGEKSAELAETKSRLGTIKPGDVGAEHYKQMLLKKQKVQEGDLLRLESNRKMSDRVSKGTFRFAGTKTGEALFKGAGVPGYISGGKVDSFADRAKKISDDASKRALEATKLSEGRENTIRRQAAEEARVQHDEAKKGLQTKVDTAKTTKDTERDVHEKRESSATLVKKELEKDISDILKSRATAADGSTERKKLDKDYSDKQAEMRAQDKIIEKAREASKNLDTNLAAAQKELAEHIAERDKFVTKAADTAVEEIKSTLTQVAEDVAEKIAFGRPANVVNFGRKPENDHISQLARANVKKSQTASAKREQTLKELFEGTAKGPTPPPPPTT